MHFRLIAAVALILGLAAPAGAQTDRVALVIGNRDYDHAARAETATRDARAVAATLERSGYAVRLGLDLDRDRMGRAIAAFAETVEGAERAVIYYSGYALQTGGRSYLAPVEARGEGLTDVLLGTVPVELVLRVAERAPGRAVVFLDTARREGFAPGEVAEPGLAEIEPPEGVLVVAAAPPGQTIRRRAGRESRFARQVRERFLAPGIPVAEAARGAQGPLWVAGTVRRDLALVAPESSAPSGPVDPDRAAEIAFWRAVERAGRAADYRAYLERYPYGLFAPLARYELGLDPAGPAERPTDADAAAEAALDLGAAERRRVQRALVALGFDTRGIDGIFGPGTRGALRAWQESEGVPVTGYLTARQYRRLLAEGAAAEAESEREAEARRRAALEALAAEERARDAARQVRRAWLRARKADTAVAYERYLDRFPQSRFADRARARLDAIYRAQAESAGRHDRRAWRHAREADTPEAYRAYLDRHPDGRFADRARARLDEIYRAHAEAEAAKRRDRTDWRRARERDTARAYRAYLNRHPQGRFADRAQARLDAIGRAKAEAEAEAAEPDRAGPARQAEAALGLGPMDRRGVERRLLWLDFRPGPVDGRFTDETRRAIRAFQRRRGISPATGHLDKRTLAALVHATRTGRGATPLEGAGAIRRLLESFAEAHDPAK